MVFLISDILERINHRDEMNSSFRQKRQWMNEENSSNVFPCSNCSSIFKYKRNLLSHIKVECGRKKLFVCNICHKEFTYKQNLKTHVGLVHKLLLNN